jgi:hypothetical protein
MGAFFVLAGRQNAPRLPKNRVGVHNENSPSVLPLWCSQWTRFIIKRKIVERLRENDE